MSDNTKQLFWIRFLLDNLDILFLDRPDVFVAGDLLWYPTTDKILRMAPDVLVAFGRPKGHRGSYQQVNEGGIAPQVVGEILSPGNRLGEMAQKLAFYDRWGAQEYFVYDPDRFDLAVWERQEGRLEPVTFLNRWTSPLLGVTFEMFLSEDMKVFSPDGSPFLSITEREAARRAEAQRAQEAEERASEADRRAALQAERSDMEAARAARAEAEVARLREQLTNAAGR